MKVRCPKFPVNLLVKLSRCHLLQLGQIGSILLNFTIIEALSDRMTVFLLRAIGEQSLVEDFIQKLHVPHYVDTFKMIF